MKSHAFNVDPDEPLRARIPHRALAKARAYISEELCLGKRPDHLLTSSATRPAMPRSSGAQTVAHEGRSPLIVLAAVLRVQNFDSQILKVNDAVGNPVEVGAVVVWRIVDTAKAVFDVEDYAGRSESAARVHGKGRKRS